MAYRSIANYTLDRPKDLRPIERGKDIDELLYDLLQKGLPHKHETDFIPLLPKGYSTDKMNNFIYRIGKDTKTMFSCHLDTVHNKITEVTPQITDGGFVYGATGEHTIPSILGADDKLGVWLMLQMMSKKVPGLYVFHAGEERGGIGSKFIAKETPEVVKNIDRCIALDRKDYCSIITRQMSGICCSDNFGLELCEELNKYMPAFGQFELDTHGTFTDSASYRGLIPECTNVSVGYFDQHSRTEYFDYIWLRDMLLPALCKVDWENLTTERKPVQTSAVVHHINSNKVKQIAFKDVEYRTPYNILPDWSPDTVVPKEVPPWKVGILIQKYIFDKGLSTAGHNLAKALMEKQKENNKPAKSVITTLEEQLKKTTEELNSTKDMLTMAEEEIGVYRKLFTTDEDKEKNILINKLQAIEAYINDIQDILYDTEEDDTEIEDAAS